MGMSMLIANHFGDKLGRKVEGEELTIIVWICTLGFGRKVAEIDLTKLMTVTNSA